MSHLYKHIAVTGRSNKKKDQSRMAGIWKTQYNYEGYTTNMLKKKSLQ